MAIVRHTGRSVKNKRFNSSNNLSIIRIDTYRAPEVRYLVVAGGGGAAVDYGGGGGAGGYLHSNLITGSGSFVISVGAGGAAAAVTYTAGINGNPSGILFYGPPTNNDIISYGGGGGGANTPGPNGPTPGIGNPGGSGGGGSWVNAPSGGSNVYLQGNPGGRGFGSYSGGGGGADQAGGIRSVTSGVVACAGGNGLYNGISGANIAYAGGGSGGSWPPVAQTTPGGVGGGGIGGARTSVPGVRQLPTEGNVNTGGGGGSNGFDPVISDPAKPGGSGIVILSHPNTYANATVTGSPNVTYANGNVIYRFWQSGTIDFTPIVGFTNL